MKFDLSASVRKVVVVLFLLPCAQFTSVIVSDALEFLLVSFRPYVLPDFVSSVNR